MIWDIGHVDLTEDVRHKNVGVFFPPHAHFNKTSDTLSNKSICSEAHLREKNTGIDDLHLTK